MSTPVTSKTTRVFEGVVTSDKMAKTIVVQVEHSRQHPKYRKYYKIYKRFKVHDPKEQFGTGDKVTFVECRPISKDKRWRVVYDESQKVTKS